MMDQSLIPLKMFSKIINGKKIKGRWVNMFLLLASILARHCMSEVSLLKSTTQ